MWYYNDEEFLESMIEDNYGFVYKITNLANGKCYIGKKFFYSVIRKKVKNRKNRKIVKKQSNWKDYFGSNDLLKKDVEKYHKANFKRTILRLCKTKGECAYYEAKYQFENDVLLTDGWYNGWIQCKIHQSHLKENKDG